MSHETQIYTHKLGSTLSLAGTVTLPTGTGAWSGSATVKRLESGSYTTVEELAVTLEAPGTPGDPHTILLESSSEAAANWPLAKLQCDIRFEDEAVPPLVIYSPTFVINVVQGITDA